MTLELPDEALPDDLLSDDPWAGIEHELTDHDDPWADYAAEAETASGGDDDPAAEPPRSRGADEPQPGGEHAEADERRPEVDEVEVAHREVDADCGPEPDAPG